MDTPLKPLLSPDVDTDLEDDDVAPSLSNAPPCYDALPASQPGVAQEDELEDVAFINWWKAVRSGPELRNSVFKLTYVWSGGRRCNAIHVRRLVVVRAVGIGLISTFPLSFGCIILLSVVHEFHEFHDVSYTIFASFIILFLFSAGAIFVPSAAGWAHIAYRIHRSLRAADADGDDARIYIPPIALLVVGTRFTRRPPFYEPLPFIACENLRDLGARIRKVEHRLCVQECTADPLAELEWLA